MSFLEAFPVSFDGCGYAPPQLDASSSASPTSMPIVDEFAAFSPITEAVEGDDFGLSHDPSGGPALGMDMPMDTTNMSPESNMNMDMGMDVMFDIFQSSIAPRLDQSTTASSLPIPTMNTFDFTVPPPFAALHDAHGGSTISNSQTPVPMINPVLLALSNSAPTLNTGSSSFAPLATETSTSVGTSTRTSTINAQAASWDFSLLENESGREIGGQGMSIGLWDEFEGFAQ